jgi:Glycosyltransferase family 87
MADRSPSTPHEHLSRTSALAVVLVAAAIVLLAVYWVPTVRRYYDYPQPVQTGELVPQYDFFQYYAGGHNWRVGLDPYLNYHGVKGAILFPRSLSISGYIYPPTFLPLYGLLSRASYDVARALWLALSLAVLGASLVAGVMLARGRRLVTLSLGLFFFAASNPLLFHIRQGQIDMIVAGLAVTGFLLYGRARSLPSAVLLAAAILLKVTPLVLVLAMAAYYRDWRLLAKTALAGIALVAVSLVVVHPHLYVVYVQHVLPQVSEGNPFFHNQSLLRAWSYLGSFVKFASLTAYALIVAAAAVVGGENLREPTPSGTRAARRPWAHDPCASGAGLLHSRDLQLLLLVVTAVLLFTPLSWRMAYVWVLVPMTMALAAAPWRGRPWQLGLVAAGAVLMCLPVWDHAVLDSLNIIGAGLAAAGTLAALCEPLLRRSGRGVATERPA